MRTFLATTLGVIAVGVTLIAYALGPRAAASVVSPNAYPVTGTRAVRTVQSYAAPSPRVAEPRIERASRRDWAKTALVIGGSTAGGAGIGGLIGGKKGALIGAALGGGASTLWEALKR